MNCTSSNDDNQHQHDFDLSYLQDLADKAAKEENPFPNFPIPKGYDLTHTRLTTTGSSSSFNHMEIKNVKTKGKGFHAKQDMDAGTFLLVSKPVGLVMEWEDDEFDDDDDEEDDDDDEDDMNINDDDDVMTGNRRNGLLIIRVAEAIQNNPSLWFNEISKLFPREEDLDSLPQVWMCKDAQTGMQIEHAIQNLKQVKEFSSKDNDNDNNNDSDSDGSSISIVDSIHQRLPFIIRYNCLSVETAPEMFVHPDPNKGGHVNLSATGLYTFPSYFNHSPRPNVSRWAIGDILFFVLNQSVKAGDELCISYIESELLCENAKRRSRMLEMDFEEENEDEYVNMDHCDDGNGNDDDNNDDDEAVEPVISLDVQDELMSMHPLDRIDEINRLLQQATATGKLTHSTKNHKNSDDDHHGEKDNSDNNEEDKDDEICIFKCDVHRLRTLLALTFDGLGQSTKALEEWKKCIDFVNQNLPPADEAGIALYVQGALCAAAAGNAASGGGGGDSQDRIAKEYAKMALFKHNLIFGGGVKFFRRRYAKEIELELRSSTKALRGQAALDCLWPI